MFPLFFNHIQITTKIHEMLPKIMYEENAGATYNKSKLTRLALQLCKT